MRLIIAALLTLALAGCDKGKQDQPQEQASIARIDRSLAGQEAPATPFLGPQDQPDGVPTVILNETAAKRYWPNGGAVGARVRLDPRPNFMSTPPRV